MDQNDITVEEKLGKEIASKYFIEAVLNAADHFNIQDFSFKVDNNYFERCDGNLMHYTPITTVCSGSFKDGIHTSTIPSLNVPKKKNSVTVKEFIDFVLKTKSYILVPFMPADNINQKVFQLRYSNDHVSMFGDTLDVEAAYEKVWDIICYKDYIRITPIRSDGSLAEEFSKDFSGEADLFKSLVEMIIADDDQNTLYNGIKKFVNSIIERIGY